MPSDQPDQLRRAPQQARSRARVDHMLDVADALLATEGAGALNTTRLAGEAGVAVGTVYNWFPDKAAIAEALAVRYWHELADLVAAVAELTERDPLPDPIETVMRTLEQGFRRRRGFLALWYSDLRDERLRDATREIRSEVAVSIERILAVHRPGTDTALRAGVARMMVLVGDGLLREAFRLDRDGDATVLAEGRVVIGAYVEARLGSLS